MKKKYLIPSIMKPSPAIELVVTEFLSRYSLLETNSNIKLILNFDKKSQAFYITCHILGKVLTNKSDLEACLEPGEDDEIYKLNREITEDKPAYLGMENDAIAGRSFEDIVIEYDKTYKSNKPFKIYGGQHRIVAISKALEQGTNEFHGIRVYFNLTKNQKIEIATINNTSIAVSNDLIGSYAGTYDW